MENKKILFVCLGNICRSPGAEAVFINQAEKEGLLDKFEAGSAGITDYHEGEPADERMRQHAAKRGYMITSISRPVNPKTDFYYYDIIIGMDNQNIRDLEYLAKGIGRKGINKICKITDFCKECLYDEVPDPYYGGDDGFELVLDLLEKSCKGLLNFLKSTK
jgi:protein-tyrosine phosphatase